WGGPPPAAAGGSFPRGRGALPAAPAAAAVDRVLGPIALFRLAFSPGPAGLSGLVGLPLALGAPGPLWRPIISLRRHGISILTHADAGPLPPLELTPRETIGVDLGGTKMLVGVVDSEQHVHY